MLKLYLLIEYVIVLLQRLLEVLSMKTSKLFAKHNFATFETVFFWVGALSN